jgi:hypothetical protein
MWTLNGTRIIATSEDAELSQIIARLNPINNGTVLQAFGYDEEIRKIVCVIVGDTDMDAIKALTTTATAVPLSSYDGPEGNYYVAKVAYNRKPVWKQTVRSDRPAFSPVYVASIELYPE